MMVTAGAQIYLNRRSLNIILSNPALHFIQPSGYVVVVPIGVTCDTFGGISLLASAKSGSAYSPGQNI
jgi:hypothetical protein